MFFSFSLSLWLESEAENSMQKLWKLWLFLFYEIPFANRFFWGIGKNFKEYTRRTELRYELYVCCRVSEWVTEQCLYAKLNLLHPNDGFQPFYQRFNFFICSALCWRVFTFMNHVFSSKLDVLNFSLHSVTCSTYVFQKNLKKIPNTL